MEPPIDNHPDNVGQRSRVESLPSISSWASRLPSPAILDSTGSLTTVKPLIDPPQQITVTAYNVATQENPPVVVKRPRGRPRGSKKEKPAPVPKIRKPQPAKLSKRSKAAAAKAKLSTCLMQRIFETCPISFLYKARLISRQFKTLIDDYPSIWVNCRKFNFGSDMPPPPEGLSEKQYCNLLDGKGCVEPGCLDIKAEKTYWSWYKRWCTKCWSDAIIKEDRVIREWRNNYTPVTLHKLLQCVPYSMQDSWGKPHDIDLSVRSAGEYKLNRVYRKDDLTNLKERYTKLSPGPYRRDPTLSTEEQDAALAEHRRLVETLEERREEFLEKEKAIVDAHMERVMQIEACVRTYRKSDGIPERNKEARKTLFQKRASEDLPHIPLDFVKTTKCYKEACRISRNGGTERSWQILKAKIVADWEAKEQREVEEKEKAQQQQSATTSHADASAQTDSVSNFITALPSIRDLGRQPLSSMQPLPPPSIPLQPNLPGPSSIGAMMGPQPPYQPMRVTVNSMLSPTTVRNQPNTFPLPSDRSLGPMSFATRPLASTSVPTPSGGNQTVVPPPTTSSNSWASSSSCPSLSANNSRDSYHSSDPKQSSRNMHHSSGWEPDPTTCADVRRHGYLLVSDPDRILEDEDMLEWLETHGYPWRLVGENIDHAPGPGYFR